jgi:isocitrate dehydrogenase kinase/phosphatase
VTVDPTQLAAIVGDGFTDYQRRRRAITARAHARFESRDWHGARRDALERIDAYGVSLDATINLLSDYGFSTDVHRTQWEDAKSAFRERFLTSPFASIAETYFNSLARKMFTTEGIDAHLEFLDDPPVDVTDWPSITTDYDTSVGPTEWLAAIARDCRFHVSWMDLTSDIRSVVERLPFEPDVVEVVARRFYRGEAAYVVGAISKGDERVPFALAVRHGPSGIRIAALLVGEEDVSILFSYTRAAFRVASRSPGALVEFLSGLLPHRPDAELWAAIGFRKQAKSERFRDLMRYLDESDDRFSTAQGVKGLVMIVFTLPGYDIVFKVIRDRFPRQKTVTRTQVADRYQFVARHDRAGRLVEAQRFEALSLPVDRFDPGLLEELVKDASRTVTVDKDRVAFTTVYLERRVTPLDIHVRRSDVDEAKRAIIDYGTAIKNLAASNIFPGDMLLKNFGVTSRGRVVFYDYDELTEITKCRFRSFPVSDDPDDEMADTPSYGIGPNDIFPEELPRFLGLNDDLRAAFDEQHADLFTPDFWTDVQRRIESGETIEILPYRRSRSLTEGLGS